MLRPKFENDAGMHGEAKNAAIEKVHNFGRLFTLITQWVRINVLTNSQENIVCFMLGVSHIYTMLHSFKKNTKNCVS